jgi:hypothetical protein
MPEPASPTAPREAWQHVLLSQAHHRPSWQLQDVYKLAFQVALGSEHAAPGEAAARHWLEQEIAALGAGPADPAIEPISPDGRLARLNLRPYLASGGSPDALLHAFLRTAALWHGQRPDLQQYLAWALDLISTSAFAFPSAEAQSFFQTMAEAGFPPAHHSPTYRDIYRPAYRVILLDLLPPLP